MTFYLVHSLQNEKKTVRMMNQKGTFKMGFIEEVNAQILEMPYTKGKLSMFVLLPSCSADNLKGLQEVKLPFPVSPKCFIIDLRRAAPSTIYLLRQGGIWADWDKQIIYKNLNLLTYLFLTCLEKNKCQTSRLGLSFLIPFCPLELYFPDHRIWMGVTWELLQIR